MHRLHLDQQQNSRMILNCLFSLCTTLLMLYFFRYKCTFAQLIFKHNKPNENKLSQTNVHLSPSFLPVLGHSLSCCSFHFEGWPFCMMIKGNILLHPNSVIVLFVNRTCLDWQMRSNVGYITTRGSHLSTFVNIYTNHDQLSYLCCCVSISALRQKKEENI